MVNLQKAIQFRCEFDVFSCCIGAKRQIKVSIPSIVRPKKIIFFRPNIKPFLRSLKFPTIFGVHHLLVEDRPVFFVRIPPQEPLRGPSRNACGAAGTHTALRAPKSLELKHEAVELQNEGNFDAAAAKYSEAITLNPIPLPEGFSSHQTELLREFSVPFLMQFFSCMENELVLWIKGFFN